MKTLKILMASACLCTALGCSSSASTAKAKAEFSDIASVCELSTLKCYFHNIAKAEKDAQGPFKFIN